MKIFSTLLLLSTATLTACSGFDSATNRLTPDNPNQSQGITSGVVRAQAYFDVQVGDQGEVSISKKVEIPVTVVNPSNVRFALNTDAFIFPNMSNALLSFGKIAIGDLFDNDLKICGTNKNKKCAKAYIQIYTIGTAGSGLYNAVGGYGMPLFAIPNGGSNMAVGLEAANAAVVQTVNLATAKNVLRLSDFPTPVYEIQSDFTEAGAGSYSTTLVVEYGLLE